MRWINVQEIHADGKHNAWPDICRWRGKYYVTFNSGGKGHANGHSICVLSSDDGQSWQKVIETPAAQWTLSNDPQRGALCPKLLPTEERLVLLYYYYDDPDTDASDYDINRLKQQWFDLDGSQENFDRWIKHHDTSFRTALSFTEDGQTFSPPQPLFEPGYRVWRPHTFGGRHYVIGFQCHGQSWSITPQLQQMIPVADKVEMFESATFFASDDGLEWEKVADIGVDDTDEPDFDFTDRGRALAVSRTGASMQQPAMAYLSDPPYTQWNSLELSAPLCSPAVRRVGDQWVVAGRGLYPNFKMPAQHAPDRAFDVWAPTKIWLLNDKSGELVEGATLPSWGDSAYPGIEVTPGGELLVVYYSCSQTIDVNLVMGPGPVPGKYAPASIYLARVVMD